MKNNIHDLLTVTFSTEPTIDSKIQADVIKNIQSRNNQHHSIRRTILIATIYVMVFTAFGVTAYAIYQYLTPTEVATELQQNYLAQAFDGEGAMLINESIEDNDYRITLLGYLPTENLMSYDEIKSELDNSNKTYIALAIERIDETPMEETSQSFFITPMIEGVNPITFNTAVLSGGYEGIIHNGIEYRLIHMDSIEIFAKRKIMLAIMSFPFYNASAFNYDESSGHFSKNEDFPGINILFDLPIVDSLGDEKKVNSFIEELTLEPQDAVVHDDNDVIENNLSSNRGSIFDTDDTMINQETGEEKEIINASLQTSHDGKNLQMITRDGVVLSEQAVLNNEYFFSISSSWNPRYLINIAKVLICDSDVWNTDNNGQREFLNPIVNSCEIRYYDHNLGITDRIILDNYINDSNSALVSEDYLEQLQIRTSLSIDRQYLFIYTTGNCLLYDRKQKETKQLNINLDQLSKKIDTIVSFQFINEQDIDKYTINDEEGARELLGTIDIIKQEVHWLE